MALSSIALCSRAFLKIGGETIASFDEGTAEAEIAANLYPTTRDALLSAHPWNFAVGQVYLARLTAKPVLPISPMPFELPPDLLRVISAGLMGRGQRGPLPDRRAPAPRRCRGCGSDLYLPAGGSPNFRPSSTTF